MNIGAKIMYLVVERAHILVVERECKLVRAFQHWSFGICSDRAIAPCCTMLPVFSCAITGWAEDVPVWVAFGGT